MTTPMPNLVALNHTGRMWLLSLLHIEVMCDRPVTADSWREAWGRAADYQTVCDGRKVLASGVAS